MFDKLPLERELESKLFTFGVILGPRERQDRIQLERDFGVYIPNDESLPLYRRLAEFDNLRLEYEVHSLTPMLLKPEEVDESIRNKEYGAERINVSYKRGIWLFNVSIDKQTSIGTISIPPYSTMNMNYLIREIHGKRTKPKKIIDAFFQTIYIFR